MELIEYLKHLYRYKLWLLIGLIAGGLIGGTVASTAKDQHQAVISLYIQRKTEQPNSQYFTYEGFYAQQTAVSYTDTAIKLLVTDEIVAEAARLAGFEKTPQQVSTLKGSVIAKKDAPQLITVRVTQTSRETSEKLATGLAQAIKQRTMDLNQYGDASLSIEQVESTPLVQVIRPSVYMYGAAGAIFGLIIAMMASAVWAFTKANRKIKPTKS